MHFSIKNILKGNYNHTPKPHYLSQYKKTPLRIYMLINGEKTFLYDVDKGPYKLYNEVFIFLHEFCANKLKK
jgi:hypothetical protein